MPVNIYIEQQPTNVFSIYKLTAIALLGWREQCIARARARVCVCVCVCVCVTYSLFIPSFL